MLFTETFSPFLLNCIQLPYWIKDKVQKCSEYPPTIFLSTALNAIQTTIEVYNPVHLHVYAYQSFHEIPLIFLLYAAIFIKKYKDRKFPITAEQAC